jgi:4'-phosphopantetheinyl transferase
VTPDADAVEFWVIPTDQPPELVSRLGRLLDREERRRAAAVDPLRRDRFTVVHGVVRLLAAERLGVPPAGLEWRHGPHGKPEPAAPGAGPGGSGPVGLRLNYSASGPLAVLALAVGRRVGVDVEELPDERVAARVADRFFPPQDARSVASAASPTERSARFARLWCRREACVKVYGGRLVEGLRLPVGDPGPGPVYLPVAGVGCTVRDVPLPEGFPGFRAAVAVEGDRPVRLRPAVWEAASADNPAHAQTN